MATDVHAEVTERLRRTGQRYTPARQDLVTTLLGLARPATIAELAALDPSQSQSSRYRNLAVLERCGAVRRIPTANGTARFELSEDLSHHHHHLVCSACGRIEDVTLPAQVEATLHRVTAEIGAAHGYRLHGHALELVGACGACQRSSGG
jgi:Fe2+ or Zn2+ uptake regulation protein